MRRLKPMREDDAYAFLGSFLFDHRKAQRRVGLLSGGEKSRLQMAKLMLTRGNLLLDSQAQLSGKPSLLFPEGSRGSTDPHAGH